MAYQVLHAIAGAQQLSQINQRLASIEHTLQELHVRQEAAVLGEIHYAVDVLDDVLNGRMSTGMFSDDGISRLALAEKSIRSILNRNKLLVERFRDKAQRVKDRQGKQGARKAAELLKTDGAQAVHDMQCLVGLIGAELKLEQALLLLAMQTNPADVGRRQERIRVRIQSHHEAIENLPSVEEIEDHAQACLRAMTWWERLFDLDQTKDEVKSAQKLNLSDIHLQPNEMQSGLSGYVFWRDETGTHVFSMTGEDLQIVSETEESLNPGTDQRPKPLNLQKDHLWELTVSTTLLPDRTYKLRVSGMPQPVEILIEEEVEPGLWIGKWTREYQGSTVLLRHQDYYKPKLIGA